MIKIKTVYHVPNILETFEGACGTPMGVQIILIVKI